MKSDGESEHRQNELLLGAVDQLHHVDHVFLITTVGVRTRLREQGHHEEAVSHLAGRIFRLFDGDTEGRHNATIRMSDDDHRVEDDLLDLGSFQQSHRLGELRRRRDGRHLALLERWRLIVTPDVEVEREHVDDEADGL